MIEIGLGHYLTLGAVIFSIGVIGIFLNRKNIIVILMSIELILLAVNINLVAFSIFLGDLAGQVFTLFILTVAAAEAAIGAASVVAVVAGRCSAPAGQRRGVPPDRPRRDEVLPVPRRRDDAPGVLHRRALAGHHHDVGLLCRPGHDAADLRHAEPIRRRRFGEHGPRTVIASLGHIR